jgi:hypothetical protein
VYCGWDDFRAAPPGTNPDLHPEYWDIYAQHILGNGARSPGWPADGLPICLATGLQQGPLIIADGFGGAIFEWVDYRDLYEAVYAVRMNPDGSRGGRRPANGTQVVVTTTYSYPQGMATDGVGGAYFGIQNDTQERCYVQHMRGDGSVDPLYGPQGRAVVDVAGSQNDIRIAADGNGGVYAAWDDFRSGVGAGVWAQHFGADGPTATLAALIESHASPNSVHLVWQGDGLGKGMVERRTVAGAWESLSEFAANGTGRVAFDDSQVEPGARYGYRLRYLDGTRQVTTAETWIDVPLAYVLSLAGLTPNPATSRDLNVAFTLARQGPGDRARRCVGTAGGPSHVRDQARLPNSVRGLLAASHARGQITDSPGRGPPLNTGAT